MKPYRIPIFLVLGLFYCFTMPVLQVAAWYAQGMSRAFRWCGE